MKTTIVEENNNQVVYFEGRLDTSASSQVQQELQPLIDNIKSDVILNCSKLEYISSSGLRIFLSILKSAPKASACSSTNSATKSARSSP